MTHDLELFVEKEFFSSDTLEVLNEKVNLELRKLGYDVKEEYLDCDDDLSDDFNDYVGYYHLCSLKPGYERYKLLSEEERKSDKGFGDMGSFYWEYLAERKYNDKWERIDDNGNVITEEIDYMNFTMKDFEKEYEEKKEIIQRVEEKVKELRSTRLK